MHVIIQLRIAPSQVKPTWDATASDLQRNVQDG